MVYMRARQTEDFRRSETLKAHRTFIILIVILVLIMIVWLVSVIRRCLAIIQRLIFFYSCCLQSGGCFAISRRDAIKFVPSLLPVSLLAALATVEY